jgi:hypothetical protein
MECGEMTVDQKDGALIRTKPYDGKLFSLEESIKDAMVLPELAKSLENGHAKGEEVAH